MFKFLIILYLACFLLYIPFSREPDLFDAEKVPAIIKLNRSNQWAAVYGVGSKRYEVNASYIFRKNQEGSRALVVYDPAHPENASVYKVWGYWLTAKELLVSIIILAVLFAAAVFITGKNSNIPYTEAELYRKRKYDL